MATRSTNSNPTTTLASRFELRQILNNYMGNLHKSFTKRVRVRVIARPRVIQQGRETHFELLPGRLAMHRSGRR